MNLKQEFFFVLLALFTLVHCYEKNPVEYKTESESHIEYEQDHTPVKVGVTEGSTTVQRVSVKNSQPVKLEVERHDHRIENSKQVPAEDRNWQVKPVRRGLSKRTKKIHIYLKNDERKVTKKHPVAESAEQETQTRRTPERPELTTRSDLDVRYVRFTDKDSVPAGSTHFKNLLKTKDKTATDSQLQGTEHNDSQVKEKIKIKHHHHHHHHSHVKTVVKKEPYPVEKIVHVPVDKIVEKIVHVEKKVPYKVEVEKIVEKYVKVPYDRPYAVEKIVEKKVPYAVKEYITVPVDRPYPVEKIVEKYIKVPTPYSFEKKVHVPQPYPVPVDKILPYPVVKEVEVPRPYSVIQIKEVPFYIQSHQIHHSQNYQQQQNHLQSNNDHHFNGQAGQQHSFDQNGHHKLNQQSHHNNGQNGLHESQLKSQQLSSHYNSFVNHQNQQNFDDSFFAPSNNHNQDSFRRTLKVPPKSQRPNGPDHHPITVTQQPQIKNVHTPLPQIIVGQQPKENNVQEPSVTQVQNKYPVDLQTPQTPVGFQTQKSQQEQKKPVSDNYKFDHEFPSHTPTPLPDLITEKSTLLETYSQAPQPHIGYVQSQPQFYSQLPQQHDPTQQAYTAQELMHQKQQHLHFNERRQQLDQQRPQYEDALQQHDQQLRSHELVRQGQGDPQYHSYQAQPGSSQENPSDAGFQPSFGVKQK